MAAHFAYPLVLSGCLSGQSSVCNIPTTHNHKFSICICICLSVQSSIRNTHHSHNNKFSICIWTVFHTPSFNIICSRDVFFLGFRLICLRSNSSRLESICTTNTQIKRLPRGREWVKNRVNHVLRSVRNIFAFVNNQQTKDTAGQSAR